MNAVIIIPAYQPKNDLIKIVDRLWDLGNQIIVVDDGSTEDRMELFNKLAEKAIIIHHEKNRGKGAALKTALNYIKENLWDSDVVGIMDADGQHLPEDMEKLLMKARCNEKAIIIGVRNIGKEMPLKSRIGNAITRLVFRLLSGVAISDTQTGLRAFQRHRIERFLKIEGTRYEYETNVLMACAKEKIPFDNSHNNLSGNDFSKSLNALAPDNIMESDIKEIEQDSLNIPTNTNESKTKWSSKFADYFTDAVVATDTSYSSKDISVNIEQNSYGSGNDKVTFYIADVHVADISFFQTKFASDTYGVGFAEPLSAMSDKVNAVFAINGDSYSNNRHKDNGTIIRNGIVYRMKYSPYDICVLYYDGTMKTYSASEFDSNQAITDGAYQTWIFGPELLDNNGKAKTSFFTWDYIRKSHPRSAIGYYEPGHYCMVVVDGRQNGYSRGMYLKELAKVFENLGCKAAYNLDGGHCSFMTFNSQVVNQPYKPGKYVSDCIYIGEAEKVSDPGRYTQKGADQ